MTLLAAFGKIDITSINKYPDIPSGGLASFINNIINFIVVLAGIFSLVNLIIAGFQYLSSNNEPQKIANAGNKILQTFIGIGIVAITFIIATLLGKILYNDPTALIKLKFFSPS